MNRGNSSHRHAHNHQHDQNDTSLHLQNNNSFQDYLQSSAHNLSFTNLHHNTSFEMEQDNNHHAHLNPTHNLPLSPVHRSSNYIPQSFLQKPFEENNYDEVEQRSHQWKFNLPQYQNNQVNNINTPLASQSHFQSFHESAATATTVQNQMKESLWDSAYLGESNPAVGTKLNNETTLINNFSGVLNENNLFSDMKGTPMNRRRSQNPHLRESSMQDGGNFGMDIEDDFPNPNRFHQNQMDLENFDQNGTPTLFKKNAGHIVMNYENYQQSIKAGGGGAGAGDLIRTPYKNSTTINSNHNNNIIDSIANNLTHPKSFNYLFNNVNDHLTNDFKFSPIKSIKNNPFPTPSYFADKLESGFGNFPAPYSANDLASPKVKVEDANNINANAEAQSVSSNSQTNQMNSGAQNPNTNNVPQQQQQQQSSQPCICNCKKTKCLKLYCECFAKLGYCGEGCHCHECKNRPENEDDRLNAIQEAKMRNPEAFQPKVVNESEQERKNKANNEQLKKGCNCRKTKCLKKYCECFNAGTYCNIMCKCDSCENHPRNAALILQKKNGSCGPQMTSQIIQHHQPIETLHPSLVVSQYNQSGYFQNTYNSLHLHHQDTQSNNSRGQQQFLDTTSSIYKSNALQGRLLFEDDNEDSDPNNVYSSKDGKESSKYLLNKMRKQKKPIIKNRGEAMENSDEEMYQDQSSQQSVTLKRANKRSKVGEDHDISIGLDNDMLQKKQIEDIENKLKQIQQVQLLLKQQQLLKQEQEKLLSGNQQSSYSKEEQNYNNHNQNRGQGSPQSILDHKLKEKMEALEQQFNNNGWNNENPQSQQRFISPPSNNTGNFDEECEEEDHQDSKDKGDHESTKAHQILNGIKKNKKKHLKKKDQLSEEKKQQQKERIALNREKQYLPYDDDQESSISLSNYSTLTQQQQHLSQFQNTSQQNPPFRSRLNSENYEMMRKKSSIQFSQFSQLCANPTKCSSNLFNPSSYSRQQGEDPHYNQEFFPYQSQRIKKNSAHFIKAP